MANNIFRKIFNFGSKNDQSNNVSSEEAIKRLQDVEEFLTKKQNYFEEQINKQKASALSLHREGNKRRAIQTMKRIKRYEKSLLELDGTLTTIEIQRESLMNANNQIHVFRAIQNATVALKKTNQYLTTEDVDDVMDEAAEQNKMVEEIASRLSSFASNTTNDYDEMDLEDELELLMAKSEESQLSKYQKLPDVPNATVKIEKNQVNNPLNVWIAEPE